MENNLNILSDSRPIFTIGYGGRTIEEFISLLREFSVKFLIDIRSRPYSQYKIEFSREPLQRYLEVNGIRYVYMGELLGGQPADPECYTNGKVDYQKCQSKEFYKLGVSRLRKAWEGKHYVAIMCSEGKPQDCHRSKMVGDSLVSQNIPVMHIDETGKLKTQKEVMDIIQGTSPQLDLFNSVKIAFSRKKYRSA